MRKLLLIAVGFVAFAVGYGVIAKAYPSPAPYGRAAYHGYFTDAYDTSGTYVLDNVYGGYAFPGWIYSGDNNVFANNFIAFIESQLGGNNQQRTGASFIIQTMIGSSRNRPPSGGEVAAWENLVRQYAAAGRVHQSSNYCYNLNSYFQGTRGGGGTNDDAFYDGSGCAVAIVFDNPNGTQYAIKHLCANPVGNGSLNPLPPIRNFSMSGRTTVDNNAPFPGQTITFSHYVKDNGPTDTFQDIWYAPYNSPANTPIKGGQDSFGYTAGQEKLVDVESVPIDGSMVGQKICQYILFQPVSSSNGGTGTGLPVCATVRALTPSCSGSTVNPSAFGPTDSYTVTAVVNFAGGKPGADYVNSQSNFYIHIVGPGVNDTNGPYDDVPATSSGSASSSGVGVLTASVSQRPTNNAGNYTVTYGIKGPVSAINCPPMTFRVSYTPYFAISGGDVAAGPGFGAACVPKLSKIRGNNLGGSAGYFGAGTQLGAFALGQITGFATNTTLSGGGAGSNSSGIAPTQPSGLAFSNAGTSPTVWGTSFGKDPTEDPVHNPSFCAPDYYGDATSGATTPLGTNNLNMGKLSSLSNGKTYTLNGNLTTNGTLTLGGGGAPSRVTIVVKGNVYLNGDIRYANYTYVSGVTNVGSIPQFRMIVQGNIFVDRTVTTLTGVYVAQPGGANTGTIYTCSQGFNYLTNTTGDTAAYFKADANYYNDCNQRLTIYGAASANYIKFNRSSGNWKQVGAVGNAPAEKIVYTPELWLGGVSGTAPGPQPFEAITNLPPIF